MRTLPPLRALQVFEAAAQFQNFSKAADDLCVTHGAVSHQIRALEAWLGLELFVRHKEGIRLTGEGSHLFEACRDALENIEAACKTIRQSKDSNRIRVGCPVSFIGNWLIPSLERFERDFPDCQLELRVSAQISDLLARDVDALIISGQLPRGPEIEATWLAHDAIGPVCATGQRKVPQTARDLESALLHTSSRPHAWKEWAECANQTLNTEGGRTFDSLSLTLEAAKNGLGFAIAPELLVKRDLAEGRLHAPFGFVQTRDAIHFCTLSAIREQPAIAALRNWLVSDASARRSAAA